MFALEIYEVVKDERTYFTSDFELLQKDGFAINLPILIVWINVWVIVSIVCWAVIYLVDSLMKDVVKFEKSTAQFGRYFSPAIREKIQESEFDLLDNENNTQIHQANIFLESGFNQVNLNFQIDVGENYKIGIMHLAAGIWKDGKDMRVDKTIQI